MTYVSMYSRLHIGRTRLLRVVAALSGGFETSGHGGAPNGFELMELSDQLLTLDCQ